MGQIFSDEIHVNKDFSNNSFLSIWSKLLHDGTHEDETRDSIESQSKTTTSLWETFVVCSDEEA